MVFYLGGGESNPGRQDNQYMYCTCTDCPGMYWLSCPGVRGSILRRPGKMFSGEHNLYFAYNGIMGRDHVQCWKG